MNSQIKHPNNKDLLSRFSLLCMRFDSHKEFFKNLSFDMSWQDKTKTVETNISGVEEENLVTVLTLFRNFYMKDSDLNFLKVTSAIINDNTLVTYHQKAREFQDAWISLLDPSRSDIGGLVLKIGDDGVSPKKNFDVWMNEDHFHIDKYKPGSGRGLDAIKSHPVFENISKLVMVDMLQRLSSLVLAFNLQVVREILKSATV